MAPRNAIAHGGQRLGLLYPEHRRLIHHHLQGRELLLPINRPYRRPGLVEPPLQAGVLRPGLAEFALERFAPPLEGPAPLVERAPHPRRKPRRQPQGQTDQTHAFPSILLTVIQNSSPPRRIETSALPSAEAPDPVTSQPGTAASASRTRRATS